MIKKSITPKWAALVVLIVIGVSIISYLLIFKNDPIRDCIKLCKEYTKTHNVSSGPCLSDREEDKWNHKEWVCDIAHNPRLPIDNLPQNQCKKYREGEAHHFVEVDEECNLIRYI